MDHNIQTASFSSSEDEGEGLFVPTSNMISQYNREYSLVVKAVERFLKETTECVQRFVTFHNFGVNLNLAQLLGNFVNIENTFKTRLGTTEAKQQKDPKLIAKHKYQSCFNRVIQRMADLFNELIDCELEFKKNYFDVKTQQRPRQAQEVQRASWAPVAFSVSSLTKSSTSKDKLNLYDYIVNEEKEEHREAQLRATLNERLKPKTAVVQTECKEDYSTTENLYRLNEKIDQSISDIKATRSREEKLIELFNLSRVKKIHSPLDATQCFTSKNISIISPSPDEGDGEGEEEMDSILESWRQIRKKSDCYTEKGQHSKRFLKKRAGTDREQT